MVSSFDLQKVLYTPHSKSTLIFYSRKYCEYNLTVYENATKRGDCFLCGECEGKRGAVDIASCVRKWILGLGSRKSSKSLKSILYCDNCIGQNKNRSMFSMLYYTVHTTPFVESITLKFLEKGHTYMGADTVHGTITSFTKNRPVMAPSVWFTMIESSRLQPEPFVVSEMRNNDFDEFLAVQSKILPQAMNYDKGDQVVWSGMRMLLFEKGANKMTFKYSFVTNKARALKIRSTRSYVMNIVVPKAYKEHIPISTKKYEDLKKLCENGVIPTHAMRQEYLTLPHSAGKEDIIDLVETYDYEDN